jgi:hypothetical protein
VSVGHVARHIEEQGMATTAIFTDAFEVHARQMSVPRVLLTPNPMGRPVGPPGRAGDQRAVVQAALGLIESAPGPGTVVRFDGLYRPGRSAHADS